MNHRYFHQALLACLLALTLATGAANAQSINIPPPTSSDYTIHDFHFENGQSLSEIDLHCLTFGQPLNVKHYCLIIPDSLSHGKSSKPSDSLRANEILKT